MARLIHIVSCIHLNAATTFQLMGFAASIMAAIASIDNQGMAGRLPLWLVVSWDARGPHEGTARGDRTRGPHEEIASMSMWGGGLV